MSLLADLANGKEVSLAGGGKLTITYEVDADVMKLSIGGNAVDLTSEDLNKILQIEMILRAIKNLESKV